MINETPQRHILAFGGGVDSTALWLMAIHRERAAALLGISQGELLRALPKLDAVVFADPGAEWPETYLNVSRARMVCDINKLEFVTVRKGEVPGTGAKETITEWCLRLGVVPLMPGGSHVCSLKFKGEVMQRWAEHRFGKVPTTWYVGIEAGEEGRSKRFTVKDTGGNHRFVYPLIELGLDRAKCEWLIERLGWPKVHKSSCVFCPFMQQCEISEALSRPETRETLIQLEVNFEQASERKFNAWQAAGCPTVGTKGRAPRGMWRRNSWKEGARLFAKSVKGRRLSVVEWIAQL